MCDKGDGKLPLTYTTEIGPKLTMNFYMSGNYLARIKPFVEGHLLKLVEEGTSSESDMRP